MSLFDLFKRKRPQPAPAAASIQPVARVAAPAAPVAAAPAGAGPDDDAVLVAYDGESGLEIARREVPDLIFLDIVLPGIDGFSALRILRRDPLTKDVPIIMISGNAQATEQFYVQRIGADDFMKKPFSRPEVFSRIEALLDETGTPRHVARPAQRPGAAAQPATPA